MPDTDKELTADGITEDDLYTEAELAERAKELQSSLESGESTTPSDQPAVPESPPEVTTTPTGNLTMQCPACGGGRLYFKQPGIRTLNFPELSIVTMPNTGNQNCNKCDAWFMLAFPEQQFPMPLALKPMPPPQSDTGIITAKSIPKIPKGPFGMQ